MIFDRESKPGIISVDTVLGIFGMRMLGFLPSSIRRYLNHFSEISCCPIFRFQYFGVILQNRLRVFGLRIFPGKIFTDIHLLAALNNGINLSYVLGNVIGNILVDRLAVIFLENIFLYPHNAVSIGIT